MIGYIFGVYPATTVLVSFLTPYLLNHFGRLQVLVLGGVIVAVGTLGFGLANSLVWFAVGRVVQGV